MKMFLADVLIDAVDATLEDGEVIFGGVSRRIAANVRWCDGSRISHPPSSRLRFHRCAGAILCRSPRQGSAAGSLRSLQEHVGNERGLGARPARQPLSWAGAR